MTVSTGINKKEMTQNLNKQLTSNVTDEKKLTEKIKSVSYKALIGGLGVVGGLLGKGILAVHAPILAKKIIVYQMGGGWFAELNGYLTAGALSEKIIYFGGIAGAVIVPTTFFVVSKLASKCLLKLKE